MLSEINAQNPSNSQKAYSDIEAGKTNITLTTLNKISKFLDVNIEDILNFNSDKIIYQNNNKIANGFIESYNHNTKEHIEDITKLHARHINDLKNEHQNHINNLQSEIKFLREELKKQK